MPSLICRGGFGSRLRISSEILSLSPERPPAGEHLVKHDPQGPDIGPAIEAVGLAADLFGAV